MKTLVKKEMALTPGFPGVPGYPTDELVSGYAGTRYISTGMDKVLGLGWLAEPRRHRRNEHLRIPLSHGVDGRAPFGRGRYEPPDR